MSRFMIQRGRSRGRGRYEEARDEYARALEATVTAHGEWSGAAARLQNDMGVVEWRLGNLAQAETLYRRALAIQEELGEEAQDIAPVLNNLATLLCDQDRYDMALPLHRRAVEVDERRLGPDHPDLALTLNNLAALYCEHGKAAEAAAMHRRALAIQQKVRRFRRRSAGRVLTARSPSFVTLPPHRLRDVSAAEVAHFSRIVSLSLSLSASPRWYVGRRWGVRTPPLPPRCTRWGCCSRARGATRRRSACCAARWPCARRRWARTTWTRRSRSTGWGWHWPAR
jgi:tetratricopeptide (TPR) repeat protein